METARVFATEEVVASPAMGAEGRAVKPVISRCPVVAGAVRLAASRALSASTNVSLVVKAAAGLCW